MIRAVLATKNSDRKILLLGLSFGNLDRLRAAPLDTHIRIDGKQLGLNWDVMIVSGETEEDIARMVRKSVPDANLR